MGEIRFYHLTERPLERVLPVMLERSLERGWRVVVRGTDLAPKGATGWGVAALDELIRTKLEG